jgi:hypothetical protein
LLVAVGLVGQPTANKSDWSNQLTTKCPHEWRQGQQQLVMMTMQQHNQQQSTTATLVVIAVCHQNTNGDTDANTAIWPTMTP